MRIRNGIMAVLVGGLVISGVGCGTEPGNGGISSGGAGGSTTTTTDTTTATPPPHGRPAGLVVWQVHSGDGLIPSGLTAAEVPTITIYGDGRIFVVAATDAHRPGHPVPMERGQVAPDDLAAFVRSVEASDLFSAADVDFGTLMVTDMPSTQVRFRRGDGRTPEASVYALGADDELTEDLTEVQMSRRRALEDLMAAAERLVTTTEPWTPDRIRVTEISARRLDTSKVPAPWPGPPFADFLETPRPGGPGRGCGELSGEAASAVSAAAGENEGVRFEHEGDQRYLVVAALLPGEGACAPMLPD